MLDHLLINDGLINAIDMHRPNPEKIHLIHDFSSLRNVKDVHEFIALASYCRRFVKNFVTIALHLTWPIHKHVTFQWNETCKTISTSLNLFLPQHRYRPILISLNHSIYI